MGKQGNKLPISFIEKMLKELDIDNWIIVDLIKDKDQINLKLEMTQSKQLSINDSFYVPDGPSKIRNFSRLDSLSMSSTLSDLENLFKELLKQIIYERISVELLEKY